MQSLLNEPNATETWTRIAPLLDGALDKLGSKDRDALALRFFENKSLAEIGAALGASEDAAKVRVNRALEKLRKIFTKRGVTLSALAIAGAVTANSVQAAPAGLTATVTAAAVKGTVISATLTTLVKGTMKTMTWLKLKFAIGAGLAVLAIGGATVAALSADRDLQMVNAGTQSDPAAAKLFRNVMAKYLSLTNYSDTGIAVSAGGLTNTFKTLLGRPNHYLVEWDQQTLPEFSFHGAVWSVGNGDFFFNEIPNGTTTYWRMKDAYTAQVEAMGFSGSAPYHIPSLFAGRMPTGVVTEDGDEQIGSVACLKLVNTLKDRQWKIWVGKDDLMVRKPEEQYFTKPAGKTTSDEISDETLKVALNKMGKPATPESIAQLRRESQKVKSSATEKSAKAGLHNLEFHENILVNRLVPKENFSPKIPTGIKPTEKPK